MECPIRADDHPAGRLGIVVGDAKRHQALISSFDWARKTSKRRRQIEISAEHKGALAIVCFGLPPVEAVTAPR
jgi:hypothetical protein